MRIRSILSRVAFHPHCRGLPSAGALAFAILLPLQRDTFLERHRRFPRSLQRDMRVFFGAYSKACTEADALLFKAGDAATIDEACKRSTVGKLLPDDLYQRGETAEDCGVCHHGIFNCLRWRCGSPSPSECFVAGVHKPRAPATERD